VSSAIIDGEVVIPSACAEQHGFVFVERNSNGAQEEGHG
jgi:hypothetical protein